MNKEIERVGEGENNFVLKGVKMAFNS